MELSVNSSVNKLILLFIFDKMEFPILENNVLDIASQSNNWIPWMECKEAVGQLLEAGFIYLSDHENKIFYSITPDGRMCLSHFYMRVPASLRDEITDFIKDNRMRFRRKQEYFCKYYQNPNGTHTVEMKILDPSQSLLEIKLNVSGRGTAKSVARKWDEKASQIYFLLHEQLID